MKDSEKDYKPADAITSNCPLASCPQTHARRTAQDRCWEGGGGGELYYSLIGTSANRFGLKRYKKVFWMKSRQKSVRQMKGSQRSWGAKIPTSTVGPHTGKAVLVQPDKTQHGKEGGKGNSRAEELQDRKRIKHIHETGVPCPGGKGGF